MTEKLFKINSDYQPQGDQPQAIQGLTSALRAGSNHNVLLGVTGSGKTFTMAHVIAQLNKPTLLIAPNKTLAAQLFMEMKEIFPENSVNFFISYYDYYQPEAYLPSTDTFIEKDSAINDDIDKMRHAATMSLFERRDVIIVSSVSCIYGLGSPTSYSSLAIPIEAGQEIERNAFLRKLIDIQYTRNDAALERGSFRVRGEVVDILPSHQKDDAIRVEFFGDEIESIQMIDVMTGKSSQKIQKVTLYPNSHYVTDARATKEIVKDVLKELGWRLQEFRAQNKSIEFQRLEMRTMHDIELLEQLGFCPGIENYSRFLTGVAPGHPPPTLLDYFPKDYLTIIDESHITVPQINGMYRGDRARKTVLVDFGFRLPAALDNRPLNFTEFEERTHQTVYVSATPREYEVEKSKGHIYEQIIRPTGLIDPQIEVRPARHQVDDLYAELKRQKEAGGRSIITTLTKKMAEDLTTYFKELEFKVSYIHADIDSLERMEILRDLRKGEIDIVIGINLLREGIDLPEVTLVAVMDADKEGFLRSKTSLIQIVGRAARNQDGRVIFYADRMTPSMRDCIDETDRRRAIQVAYNTEHGITPTTINKGIGKGLREIYGITKGDENLLDDLNASLLKKYKVKKGVDLEKAIKKQIKLMKKAAGELDFETAAQIKIEIKKMRELLLQFADL